MLEWLLQALHQFCVRRVVEKRLPTAWRWLLLLRLGGRHFLRRRIIEVINPRLADDDAAAYRVRWRWRPASEQDDERPVLSGQQNNR